VPVRRPTSRRTALPGYGRDGYRPGVGTIFERIPMAHSIAWNQVSRDDVVRAIADYDRLGAQQFFAEHGFAPATTYQLVWEGRSYPPKAILGTAYELATGQRLASADFEGGKSGAVKVLGDLGFTVLRL